MYAKTKELPECLQSALKEIGYFKSDIVIESREKVSRGGGATFEGNRAFCVVVNLSNGERKTEFGSFGGSNMFVKTAVDDDNKEYELLSGFAVIQGETGGRGTFARVILHKDNIVPLLNEAPKLVERDRWVLYTFEGLTSSGRIREWQRENDVPSEDDLKRFCELGYLKRDKAGKTSITTEGKNALGRKPGQTIYHPNRN